MGIDTNIYRLTRDEIGTVFDQLKRLANVRFEHETVFARALHAYRENNCDFADAVVGMLNEAYGYGTASFDKGAARELGFSLLKA